MIAASPGERMVLTGILVDLHVGVVLERRDNQSDWASFGTN